MIFPVCDPDEMRLVTDSDPIIGSWPGGEGAVDVVSEMGLSRLIYFNVINWEDHIRTLGQGLVLGQAIRVGGHRGSGLQMWPLAESSPDIAVSLVWWVVSPCPQFLPGVCRNSRMPPLPVTSLPVTLWHNVGVIPAIRRQGSQLIIDRFQSWLTSLAPGPVGSEWVGVIQRLCQSSGCQLKLLFLSKELKMLLVLLTVAYQSQASWGSRSMHHSHTFTCSG